MLQRGKGAAGLPEPEVRQRVCDLVTVSELQRQQSVLVSNLICHIFLHTYKPYLFIFF